MKRRPGDRRAGAPAGAMRALIRGLAGERLRLADESVLLLLLSTLDLLVTYLLLRQGGGRFYESNPVAGWLFARWNIAGMTYFKYAVVAVAIVACEVVERHRPGLGRWVLQLGSLAAAGVAAYGAWLYFGHAGQG